MSGSVERSAQGHPTPPDELEVEIEKLVAGGEGLARVDGFPLFIPLSVPGDRLKVRVTERKSSFGRAEILEVLRPGEGRREPPCEFFGRCGGCDLQQIEDDLQSRLKAEAAVEVLSKIGGVQAPERLTVVTGDPWGYRLRSQLRVEGEEGRVSVGYRERGSHRLVAVNRCPILVPELEELVGALPGRLAGGEPPRRLDLAAGGEGRITTAPVVQGLPTGAVERQVGEFSYAYDARCFFQAHAGLLPRFVEAVVGQDSGRQAYDLFCGVGLFTLPLARRYGQVVAVEGDRVAARYCRINARKARLKNVEVAVSALETWVRKLPAQVDRVVVDPPRAGLPATVLRAIMDRRPRRLTYASCHAATLARDLRRLLEAFELTELVLVDLFPQTGHMESVAQLALR